MRVGSLFAGIGGFDLGLERAGFDIAWQVEIDPYCQRVLAKHWPTVQRYGDIRVIDWSAVEPVDLLCGGFPCQDISLAGKGAGLSGERSGLWFEYAKAIDALKPRYVLIENVAALRSRGLDQVLGSLAALGYDAEWHCIPASAVGAPHRRDRVWIVAHATSQLWNGLQVDAIRCTKSSAKSGQFRRQDFGVLPLGSSWESYQPRICRENDGIPRRVDRLRGLGNAIVPQIAEMIGRWIQFREEITQ